MAKRDTRAKARELRAEGKSVREIAEQLAVSRGSVSQWVRDIELSDDQLTRLKALQRRFGAQNAGAQANKRDARERRMAWQQTGREQAKNGSTLHLVGCMLYWAEGAKARNGIYFANSDPQMVFLFMRFLREEHAVEDGAVKLLIHCHSDNVQEVRRIEHYWLDLLKLPPSALQKTQIKRGSQTRKNILKNGVCSIRVFSTEVTQQIYGAIQEYGGFDNPDWLF